jgi:HD superfamily phosphohydrolase
MDYFCSGISRPNSSAQKYNRIMKGHKIFNDPVYGFIRVPYGLIFEVVDHPWFQRLRRIKQLSLTHYVYPGALHTRFHHALGAMHLMGQALQELRLKGVDITDEELEAARIAILLHDIGHGPFSHTLENTLINVSHETLSVWFMERMNQELGGRLALALKIFKDEHHKPFLHQLISGQLDMDRMDYLNRDSFFTGVHEGVIGYDRIVKMLDVKDGQLVIEEKGIYSIEKFLMARRLMYWQVYLHKTVLAAELMLIQTLKRAKQLACTGTEFRVSKSLEFFLLHDSNDVDQAANPDVLLQHFAKLDDYDIMSALKEFVYADDALLSFLAESILNRKLFKLEFSSQPVDPFKVDVLREAIQTHWESSLPNAADWLLLMGAETNSAYTISKDEINILFKNGQVRPMSESTDYELQSQHVVRHYLCYPKHLGTAPHLKSRNSTNL